MEPSVPNNTLNALLFITGWLACMLAGGHGLWLVAAVMLVHLWRVGSWQHEGKLLVCAFLFGSALDSFLLQLGIFDFGAPRQLVPLWLALSWLLLGTTLRHCLAWTARPWWYGSLLGACYAPASYGAAAALGEMNFPHGATMTLVLLALLWAAVLPLLHGFAQLHAPGRPA